MESAKCRIAHKTKMAAKAKRVAARIRSLIEEVIVWAMYKINLLYLRMIL